MLSLLRQRTLQSPLQTSFRRTTLRSFNTRALLFQKSASQATKSQQPQLTWNEFLALRLKRRQIYVMSSCFTALGGVGLGWAGIANVEIDPTEMILGFDPFIVLGIGLVACGCLGYLAGPSVGDVVFRRIVISKQAKQFSSKNAEFLRHIQQNRPDPRKQSYGNPVTDFYGEKIGSLKDYRQWLRDGKAYKRKSEKFL